MTRTMAQSISSSAPAWSKGFFEGPQVQLVRPCAGVLKVQLPIGLRDGVDREHAVDTLFLVVLRKASAQAGAVDTPINDDVSYVKPLRPKLARQRLCDHPQARLAGGKMRIAHCPPQ